jgi:fructoselysine/glucoselysine PTS system EIIA component
MRKFLIATHGSLAGGAQSSLEMILGSTDNIFVLQAYAEENKSIQDELEIIFNQVSATDEMIIFTDLMGGSVTNQVLQYTRKENVYVISGFNLPLLLDIVLADADTPVMEVIETGIQNAKDQIVFVNKLLAIQ